jgi:hypothetical protein
MMRAGLCRPVHVKTLRSQKLQMLLTHRKLQSLMSALCQKQTFRYSFDYLVSPGQQDRRNSESERLRSSEIDGEIKLGRPFDRQVTWICTFEDSVDEVTRPSN